MPGLTYLECSACGGLTRPTATQCPQCGSWSLESPEDVKERIASRPREKVEERLSRLEKLERGKTLKKKAKLRHLRASPRGAGSAGLMVILFLAGATTLLAPPAASGQGPISPGLRALLDSYFPGPGASNSVTREMIRDGAVSSSKVDIPSLSSVFATPAFVASYVEAGGYVLPSDVPGNEEDPGYEADKPNLVRVVDLPSYGFLTAESDPRFEAWSNSVSGYFSGAVTNPGVALTNVTYYFRGLVVSNQVFQ